MKNRLFKKIAAAAVTAVLIGTLTAGCGASSMSGTETDETEEASDEEISDDGTEDVSAVEAEAADEDAEIEVTTIQIATSGSPNPFSYVDEDDNITGYDVEIIKAVFDRLPQYDYEITLADFTGIFGGLDTDLYQVGVNNFSYNEERAEKYLYSTALFKNEYVIAVASDNDDISSLEDLIGKSTMIDPDTTYATALQDFNEEHADTPINITYYDDVGLVEVLRQVEDGTYDFQIIDKPMFDNYLEEYDLELKGVTLTEEESLQITTPYSYALVSQGHEDLLEDIDAELALMVEDGTIKEISEQFFNGNDYTPYDVY